MSCSCNSHNHSNSDGQLWFTLVCACGLALGAVSEFTSLIPEFLSLPFYIISYFGGGYYGIIETVQHLRRFQINIDFLMIAAATGIVSFNMHPDDEAESIIRKAPVPGFFHLYKPANLYSGTKLR